MLCDSLEFGTTVTRCLNSNWKTLKGFFCFALKAFVFLFAVPENATKDTAKYLNYGSSFLVLGVHFHSVETIFTLGTKVGFHVSGPTSQFLNGTYELSELVLVRMALLMDQSRSILPLRSAKAREFGELWRKKYTRMPWTFPFKLARTIFFGWPERTNG